MLRVRPVHFTSRIDEFAAELEGGGLRCTENHGSWRVFDSGSGKVGVHAAEAGSPEDGTTVLGFEVRDCEIFVRRTVQDGTAAELVDSRHGSTARVTAPDGFTFLADPSTDLHLPGPASPDSVTAIWHTPDPVAANTVLANIGATFERDLVDGGALFRARNGGFVATAKGAVSGVELQLKHDGGTLTVGAVSEI